MGMKKRMAFLICAVIIAVIAIICASMFMKDGDEEIETERRVRADEVAKQESGYVIKDLDGKLAVYRTDDMNTPERVTEIYSETLRKYDQELLHSGIKIADEEELWRILEDYGS